MRAVDPSYRRQAAANALLRFIWRKKPQAIQQLVEEGRRGLRYQQQPGAILELSGYEQVVKQWCKDLKLECDAIESEALDVMLVGVGVLEEDAGDDDEFYHLPVIPGESLRTFQNRAQREYYRRHRGAIQARLGVNPKHVEWLCRYQLVPEGYEKIAKAYHVNDWRDVKRAVRVLADLLGIKLRPPLLSGRPRTGRRSSTPNT